MRHVVTPHVVAPHVVAPPQWSGATQPGQSLKVRSNVLAGLVWIQHTRWESLRVELEPSALRGRVGRGNISHVNNGTS